MTVKELKEKLANVDENAEVVIYNNNHECDGLITTVAETNIGDYTKNYYCCDDTDLEFTYRTENEDFYNYTVTEEGYEVRDGVNPYYANKTIVVLS